MRQSPEKRFDSESARGYPSDLLQSCSPGDALAKKKLLVTVAIIAAALVLVNVILGFVVAEEADDAQKRCAYSLYRLSVALVEYSNVHNATLTPTTLRELVTEGIVEESWLRCSEYSSEFGYFGQFDLLGPAPPMTVWCKTGHTMDMDGIIIKTTYIMTGRHRLKRCTFGYLEERLKEVDAVRDVIARDALEDGNALLGIAESNESPCVRCFALWKLAQTRSREYEKAYIELLEDKSGSVQFEAALGLVHLGSPAGGAVLMRELRDGDYFPRRRAFRALKELAGDGFGFEPALDPESQPGPMGRFDEWWAKTAKSLRETGSSGSGG